MLNLAIHCRKATANLAITPASCQEARSPVAINLAPVYHYQFSSVGKTITRRITKEADGPAQQRTIQALCISYYKHPAWQPYFRCKQTQRHCANRIHRR